MQVECDMIAKHIQDAWCCCPCCENETCGEPGTKCGADMQKCPCKRVQQLKIMMINDGCLCHGPANCDCSSCGGSDRGDAGGDGGCGGRGGGTDPKVGRRVGEGRGDDALSRAASWLKSGSGCGTVPADGGTSCPSTSGNREVSVASGNLFVRFGPPGSGPFDGVTLPEIFAQEWREKCKGKTSS